MVSPAALRIRLTVAIAVLALVVSAIGFGVAHSIHRAKTAEYQRRCTLYAVALASTSGAWLPTGGLAHDQSYPLLSLGVVYLRVSIDGEIVMDARRPEFSTATLPQLDQHSLAGTSVVCFEDHWAIDVTVPHMLPNVDDPEEDGTLRTLQFGIGATELAAAYQQTTKRVALISLTAWVFASVLLVGLCILVRSKQRLAVTQPVDIPDAARRSAAGDLILLHDQLLFRVGEVEIGLTPKQAVLLVLTSDNNRLYLLWRNGGTNSQRNTKTSHERPDYTDRRNGVLEKIRNSEREDGTAHMAIRLCLSRRRTRTYTGRY